MVPGESTTGHRGHRGGDGEKRRGETTGRSAGEKWREVVFFVCMAVVYAIYYVSESEWIPLIQQATVR
uniref:Uncharacterized protein n=1 Tax=Oryza brachyantha TaxID=4533 RepID=J3LVE3_ORYBR